MRTQRGGNEVDDETRLRTGGSKLYKVTPTGEVSELASGFNIIVGLAIDKEKQLYVLENTVGSIVFQLTDMMTNRHNYRDYSVVSLDYTRHSGVFYKIAVNYLA